MSDIKLWCVTAEIEVFIASDRIPSDGDAMTALGDELRDSGMCCLDMLSKNVVLDLRQVPKDWHDSLPRGNHQGRTCQQILGVEAEETFDPIRDGWVGKDGLP